MEKALSGEGDTLFSLEDVRQAVFRETGIRFTKRFIREYNQRCKTEESDLAPLCQVDEDLYVLNRYFYKFRKVKPPRPRAYEI